MTLQKDLKVVLLDSVPPSFVEALKESGFENIRLIDYTPNEAELVKELADAEIVGVRSVSQLTREVFKAAKQLICVGRYGVGINNLDLAAAAECGVPIFNGPFGNTRSVAELTIGNLFGLMRGLPQKSKEMHEGKWPKSVSGSYEVRGKTLGIIGYGHIGSQVSVLAEAIGMNVVYTDIRPLLPLGKAKFLPLEELLKTADVVTCHVPATALTKNMINENTLALMKKGAFLINTSRGVVVNIPALKNALETKQIGGAALDVFPVEPKSKTDPFICELQGMPNVILTPHIGASTEEALTAVGKEVAEKLGVYIALGDLSMALNFPEIAPGTIQPGQKRLIIVHRNQPGAMASINEVFSEANLNIAAQTLKTLDAIGVAITDVEGEVATDIKDKLFFLSSVIKCRIIS